MSTHFTLDFSIARLATETLRGLYPQPECRTHQTAAKSPGRSLSESWQQRTRSARIERVDVDVFNRTVVTLQNQCCYGSKRGVLVLKFRYSASMDSLLIEGRLHCIGDRKNAVGRWVSYLRPVLRLEHVWYTYRIRNLKIAVVPLASSSDLEL